MTLQGLLTFIGLLLASYSAVRQPYRDLVRIFIRLGWIVFWFFLAFLALVWPLLARVVGSDVCPDTQALLEVAGFVLPLGCIAYAAVRFSRGRLSRRSGILFERAWRSAQSEGNFEGMRWIIEKNLQRVAMILPQRVLDRLFDAIFIERMIQAKSWIHLEMLAQKGLVSVLSDQFAASDAAIRGLLASRGTVLHRWVTKAHGGQERVSLTNEEKRLISRTFASPSWYMEVDAHYPLAMYPIERISAGEFDEEYNGNSEYYGLTQGTAKRSYCPVWISSKVMELAISHAIAVGENGDMYVSTLWDLFRAVVDRSKREAFLAATMRRTEYPTPFAYLMNDICRDLEELSREACQVGLGQTQQIIDDPRNVAQLRVLVQTWAGCLGYIASHPDSSTVDFRRGLLIEYLNFMLQIGFWLRDVIFRDTEVSAAVRQRYRDLFASELRRAFVWNEEAKGLLMESAGRLDQGKMWVREGDAWLRDFVAGLN